MLLRLPALLALAASLTTQGEVPAGHLQPFGSWRPGRQVKQWTTLPTPREFFDHCNSDNGHSEPVLMKGAALGMAAMKWDSDEYLLEKFGKAKVQKVEYNLKETRSGGDVQNMRTMEQFLAKYNSSDIYMVAEVPKPMQADVAFLPFMRCGGFTKFLDSNSIWFGRGGSKSVVHYDDQDNINCMFHGTKRFIFMHPKYKKRFEAHPNTPKNKFGWVDTDLDRTLPGYGAFMGKIDVDKVDLIKYPGWKDVEWSEANMEPGDCIYIPYQWYHQVTAQPTRSINAHVWYWRPKEFLERGCKLIAERGTDEDTIFFANCTWGYEPNGGHFGKVEENRKQQTMCKRRSTRNERRGAARSEL